MKHTDNLTKELQSVLSLDPETHKVANRYRTIRMSLKSQYPGLISTIEKDSMLQFIKDIIFLDRKLRQLTEGEETKLKEQLSEEAQIELGYQSGCQQDLSLLSKI